MMELRILFLEDDPGDAERVNKALRDAGLSFRLKRVETKDAFVSEIRQQAPDVILSDHGLPAFDGISALTSAKDLCPAVPFIFVTNALTREMEIEKLSPGVTDYVLKTHLEHLGPAILRALDEREWRAGPLTEQERRRVIAKLRLLLKEYELIPICAHCQRIRDNQDQWSPADSFFRKHLNLKFTHSICPACAPLFFNPEE